ncbi:hypothetical protein BSL78_06973 [Apostichopus japonicus]|uniref:ubiquitinyl hydrolase 1 n=1 Tax=Stichopus japonicus TaxID=307972 RepID=A0A2G8L728_STIJA|nr:hypothetical protein BSL78_06973 [Apostichopus japonicus]
MTVETKTGPGIQDGEAGEENDSNEVEFPLDALSRLDTMINKPRWIIPVLPKGELEVLLEASIELCKKGLDIHCEPCQRFFQDGLMTSFTKILTDEAVSGWKFEIQRCILKNSEKLIELAVIKLSQDWFPLLDLLAMALNPHCKFHVFNATRQSETAPEEIGTERFAKPPDARTPKGWLVDLINKFGSLEGFEILQQRFLSKDQPLNVSVIHALIRPWGMCYEMLTQNTVQTFFMPIVDRIVEYLDSLSDEELKKESKNESRNDALSLIIKSLKNLVSRVPKQEEKIKSLEMFRLKMILRLLKISSFNGKMNALNEVNKVISNVSYYTHKHSHVEDEEWLTAERMAEWIQENKVLSIVLRDNLHQPQYVEKLEKILRFVIKEKALTKEDLDNIWAAQVGKHEAIVKNIHDLLAKLAWDFSPEQLDHLFDCFQESWTSASTKQREKLLELIRRLAEDDKDGLMAHKVLSLLWTLAHQDDVPTDIMDQALHAHIKILDYSCSQDRDAQKIQWIDKFVDELKNDKWVLPALKQIKEICSLFGEAPQNYTHAQHSPHLQYRHDVINKLQGKHSLVTLVAGNLSNYMNKARKISKENPSVDPQDLVPDSRYTHAQQVQERLNFLRFLLKDGQLWLCAPQAKQIWTCLAENSVYVSDREACFKWFSKLMSDEPDLDPEINKDFFELNILLLDPSLLTENGIKCFDRFFKAVNSKEGKLIPKRRAYLMDDLELIGLDYLWRVVLCAPDEIAAKAIELLKETYTNLGPRLQANQVDIHIDFIQSCMDRLKAMYDTLRSLEEGKDGPDKLQQEATRMTRVLSVLREYVHEYDLDFMEERTILPMARAHRGKHVTLQIRFSNQNRQGEDLDIWSHTNESLASVRRQILLRVKASPATTRLDLYINGEFLDPTDDRKLIGSMALRDRTLITAKLCPIGSNMPSSPDSSSDSSGGSPQHPCDGPNIEAEKCLPGVLMSTKLKYVEFLFNLADIGCVLGIPSLRGEARALLKIIPGARTMSQGEKRPVTTAVFILVYGNDDNLVPSLNQSFLTIDVLVCSSYTVRGKEETKLISLFPCLFDLTDARIVEQLQEVCASAAENNTQSLESVFFGTSPSQVLYFLEVVYAMLMPAKAPTGPEAFKFQFNFLKSGGIDCVINMLTKNNFLQNGDLDTRRWALHLVLKTGKLMFTTAGYAKLAAAQEAYQSDPNTGPSISQAAHTQAVILQQALQHIPNPTTECMLRNVAIKLGRSVSEDTEGSEADLDDANLCREALEVLSICLALCPTALDALNQEKHWKMCIVDLLLLAPMRHVRLAAMEQFLVMATKCTTGTTALHVLITLSFSVLQNKVKENFESCGEYFGLLCRLLNYAYQSNNPIPNAEILLNNEIDWLKKVRDEVLRTGESFSQESLLDGHLGITKELLSFMSSEKKFQIGAKKDGCQLIKELMEDFLFPASKVVVQTRKNKAETPLDPVVPVCASSASVNAAFELLVALCVNCVANMKLVVDTLREMYYSGHEAPLVEWEYLPPIGPRPHKGFVGLKNAGATCYMNSVLQQLYMVPDIKKIVLAAESPAIEHEDDFDGDEKQDNETNIDFGDSEVSGSGYNEEKPTTLSKQEQAKEYNLGVLKNIQAIFAHLAESKLQYYVPRGFWKHFKLMGEPVNLREQHDALEFFNSVVDSLDEALKAVGASAVFLKCLGGSYADQKICKGCPHRYSRETMFTSMNVDIRNNTNLFDSLEQFVKGDLLEGDNAYLCEKCNKKVDTVKRMCVKKCPKILAIQLKRFDYDWERECAMKFNDYFEFPREFDLEPYTVEGLAKLEADHNTIPFPGEEIQADERETSDLEEDLEDPNRCTKYRLIGVVVHSGQASGGHYYSYILQRQSVNDVEAKWYKFDDGEVMDCRMDDDEDVVQEAEEMVECLPVVLRENGHRQEGDTQDMENLTITPKSSSLKMPPAIQRSVRKKNIQFMHSRMQYSQEYFLFMRKLVGCNRSLFNPPSQQSADVQLSQDVEELAMQSIQLASWFLFSVGFHTKKTLRGPAAEWYDTLYGLLCSSKTVRRWFSTNVLFAHRNRFSEYLLECPSSEVRNSFAKVIVILAHFSQNDGTFQMNGHVASLSEHLLMEVLHLLKKEVSEHGRHLTQYFQLFQMYANLGAAENAEPSPNPFRDSSCTQPLMAVQPRVEELLYSRGGYVKKLIEDCNSSEETTKLLRFCCWEHPQFSLLVLGELLWQIAFAYTYELRPYLDLLRQILMMEDSWQQHRIINALRGIPEDRDGLFDTIQRSKNHHQKRAYQCIKCMVVLFSNCQIAQGLLNNHTDLKRKWHQAVEWLSDELERRSYSSNTQYTYNNWSPPAQSNETSNGYFLERSNSARMTLAKACELYPDEEQEEVEVMDEQEGSDSAMTYNSQPEITAQNSQQQPQPLNNQQPEHRQHRNREPPNTINNTFTFPRSRQQNLQHRPPGTRGS